MTRFTHEDDLRAVRELAPPDLAGDRDATGALDRLTLERILETPLAPPGRRARRRLAGLALAGAAAAGAIAIGVVIASGPAREVAITVGSPSGSGPGAPEGRSGIEIEVQGIAPPGVEMTPEEAADRADAVLRARAEARGIEGFEVRRVGTRLFAFVPRATEPEPADGLLGDAVFGIYDSVQIVRTAGHPLPLLALGQRLAGPGGKPGSWYIVSSLGARRFVEGPMFSRGEVDRLQALGARGRVVGLPRGLLLVSERGISDPRRRQRTRNAYYLLRGAPLVGGDHIAAAAALSSENVIPSRVRVALTPEGFRLLEVRRQRARASAGRARRFLVTVNGEILAAPSITAPALQEGQGIVLQQRSVLGSSRQRARQLRDGGASIVLDRLAARRLGGDLPDTGAVPTRIPPQIMRIITYDRRVLSRARTPRGREEVRRKILRPETVRKAADFRQAGDVLSVWIGRRNDGASRVFLLSARRARPVLVEAGCGLSPDAPAVVVCSHEMWRSHRGNVLVRATMFGRAAPDVLRVEGVTASDRRFGAMTQSGWFLVSRTGSDAVAELRALDASGQQIGRLDLTSDSSERVVPIAVP